MGSITDSLLGGEAQQTTQQQPALGSITQGLLGLQDPTEQPTPVAQTEQTEQPQFTPLESAVRGGVEGVSFGFIDEIEALKAAAFAKLGGDDRSFGEIFSNVQQFFQERGNQAQEQNPGSFLAGELGGGLLTAGGLAKTGATLVGRTVGKGLGTRAAAGATEGAGIGALVGLGTSDEDLAERGVDTIVGGAAGGALGFGFPLIGAAIGGAVRGATNKLTSAQGTAATLIAQSLKKAQTDLSRAMKRLENMRKTNPGATLADAGGQELQKLLRDAVNVPSERRAGLIKKLALRQRFQFKRLGDALGVAAGGNLDEFFQSMAGLVALRKDNAKRAFDFAFSKPLPFTRELEDVLKRPLLRAALVRARAAAQNQGEDFQGLFAKEIGTDPDGIPIFEFTKVPGVQDIHRIKMGLDDIINRLKSGKETPLKNVEFRDAVIAKQDLMKAIQVPAYKNALKQFAGDSTVLNAGEDGLRNGLKMSAEEITTAMANFSDAERQMFRMGFARALIDKIKARPVGNDAVKPVLDTGLNIERIRAVFPNATVRQLQKQIQVENLQTRTFRTVQGNSTTAEQLLRQQRLSQVDPSTVAAAGLDVAATGGVATVTNIARRTIAKRMQDTIKGLTPDVADEIIRQLTGLGDEAAEEVSRQLARLTAAEKRALTVNDLAIIGLGVPAATVTTQAAAAE